MSPCELMAVTDTVYSASGTKPCNTTLVVVVYTVVKLLEALVSVSRYLTLQFPTTLSHIEREADQVTTAVSLPITVHETSVGGFGSAKSIRKVYTIGVSVCDGVL